MKSPFKSGQVVYNMDGEELVYSGFLDNVHFVRRVYECEDQYGNCFERSSEPAQHHEPLFDKPPKAKYEAAIREARDTLKATRKELGLVRDALDKAKRERSEAEQKHSEFKLLIDYLEGRITHVVIEDYEAEIMPLEKALLAVDERMLAESNWSLRLAERNQDSGELPS